jgi:hypothetical protein
MLKDVLTYGNGNLWLSDDEFYRRDAVDEALAELEALQKQFQSLDALISERSLELRKANDKICELEALLEPKTCDGCKHHERWSLGTIQSESWSMCSIPMRNCSRNFDFKDYYEPKEQQ